MNCPNDQLSAKHYRFNKMEKEGLIKRIPNGNIELNLAKIKRPI